MQLSPSIFKAYDIRGVVPATLDAQVAEALGRAFGTLARREGESAVAVGRDGRLSSPELATALAHGLRSAGVDVLDLGLATTPMVYFAAHTVTRSGIQVTASHNPKDHNGFKLVLAGRTVFGEELQQLRRMVQAAEWDQAARPGRLQAHDVFPAYRDRILGDVRLVRPLRVAVDCGNGVAGATAPQLLRALGCEVTELHSEVDGRFPNHHPDPGQPENLRDLIDALATGDAELGLAFDGDGDRLGVVSRSGDIIYPDRQLMLFARDVLARVPGAPILFDVKCTQRLAPAIAAAGGRPVMQRSGYSLLKAAMLQADAPLAGELSGHIFFNERWYGFDDATYAAARLLEILARHDDPGAVLDALPASYATPELNVRCAEGESHRIAAALAAHASFPQAEVCTIDGLRVDWPDGFGLVRASNTAPMLTLRFEGHTPQARDRIRDEMLALLRTVKPDAVVGGGAAA